MALAIGLVKEGIKQVVFAFIWSRRQHFFFPVKHHIANIFGFMDHKISVTILCVCYSTNSAIGSM